MRQIRIETVSYRESDGALFDARGARIDFNHGRVVLWFLGPRGHVAFYDHEGD